MKVESCAYSLSLNGKAVGSQVLRTARSGRTTTLEARALWQGVFGQQSLTQRSQLLSRTGESLRFSEEVEGKSDKHTFEVVFDAETALVRATRRAGNQTDSSDTPYLRPYSDPLGLLHTLRSKTDEESVRIPMLGKDVVAERLADAEVETGLGTRNATPFILYPGPSYVYFDKDEPHTILKMIQPTTHGMLEAYLTRITLEEGTLSGPATNAPKRSENKRRRRGGRRRKRAQNQN